MGLIGAIAGVAAGATVTVVLAPVVLSAAGFTAAGVAAGSMAAGIQSVFYGGFATGLFSACQSASVVGVPTALTGTLKLFIIVIQLTYY